MHRFFALTMALALVVLAPTTTFAHERRDVGPYQFVVGFINEPALLGQPNGVDLRITRRDGNQPVEGAHETLRVSVAHGGGPAREFPLRARFGQPGAYIADLIPTRTGVYVFTFSGQIDGETVNEVFESGPGRFSEVESPQELQFPEQVAFVGDLQTEVRATEARVQQATTFGYAGTALGALGVLLGLVALLRRPRAASSGG